MPQKRRKARKAREESAMQQEVKTGVNTGEIANSGGAKHRAGARGGAG